MTKGPSSKRPSGRNSAPLPRPTVALLRAGEDPSTLGEAGIKGMLMNPLNAGVGGYPRLVTDAQWIAAAKKVLEQDGTEQFLVNLLHVLRSALGNRLTFGSKE